MCGFRIFPEANGHQVALNFDIIEPQDGVEIQIIYAGDPNAVIRVSGICEASNEPNKKEQPIITPYEAAGAVVSTLATFVLGGMFVLGAVLFTKTMFKAEPGGFFLIGSDSNPWIILLLLLPLAVAVKGVAYLHEGFKKVRKYTGFKNSAIEQLTNEERLLFPCRGYRAAPEKHRTAARR